MFAVFLASLSHVAAHVTLGQDGNLHVGWQDRTGHLIAAVSPNGSEVWRTVLPYSMHIEAADGTIFVTTPSRSDVQLHALDPATGGLQWSFDCGPHAGALSWQMSSPVAAGDRVYINCFKEGGPADPCLYEACIWALDCHGVVQWNFTTSSRDGPLPLADSSVLVHGLQDSSLVALDANGTVKWSLQAPNLSQLASFEDTVYVTDSGKPLLLAVDSNDGHALWNRSLAGLQGHVVLSDTGISYVKESGDTAYHETIRAFDSIGEELWSYDMDLGRGRFSGALMVLTRNGTDEVYVVDSDDGAGPSPGCSNLTLVKGGQALWSAGLATYPYSPSSFDTILSDGTFFHPNPRGPAQTSSSENLVALRDGQILWQELQNRTSSLPMSTQTHIYVQRHADAATPYAQELIAIRLSDGWVDWSYSRTIHDYQAFPGKNCYSFHGGTSLNSDDDAPEGLTVEECQFRCDDPSIGKRRGCSCVTFQPSIGKCWMNMACNPSGFEDSTDFVVYMQHSKYNPYADKNCYDGQGGTSIDDDDSAPEGISAEDCQSRCDVDGSCGCVTFQPSLGKCWKRSACNAAYFVASSGYTVFVKTSGITLEYGGAIV